MVPPMRRHDDSIAADCERLSDSMRCAIFFPALGQLWIVPGYRHIATEAVAGRIFPLGASSLKTAQRGLRMAETADHRRGSGAAFWLILPFAWSSASGMNLPSDRASQRLPHVQHSKTRTPLTTSA